MENQCQEDSILKLIIAEKPSVAKSIASALGASSRADGFYEGSGLLVSWCVGHLVSPMDAGGYDERFKKWRYDDLPILPEPFRYVLALGKEDAFENLRALMDRSDVDTIVNACDAGREGELIFRLVYEMTGCRPLPPESGLAGGDQCYATFLRSLSPYPECGSCSDAHTGNAGGA